MAWKYNPEHADKIRELNKAGKPIPDHMMTGKKPKTPPQIGDRKAKPAKIKSVMAGRGQRVRPSPSNYGLGGGTH